MSATRLAEATSTQAELAAWWPAASSGIETLTVRQAPVLQVTPGKQCDDFGVEKQVTAWVSTSEYAPWVTNTALLWPEKSGCWYGGLGYMPGYFTWMNTTRAKTWAHELGHNMGLPHANNCIAPLTDNQGPGPLNARPSYLSKCRFTEYGNHLDIMGGARDLSNGYNVDYLSRIGWLGNTQLAEWDGSSRTYQLARSNDATGSTRAIKIPSVKMLGTLDEGEFWVQFKPKPLPNYTDNGSGVFVMMKPSLDYLKGMGFDPETIAATNGATWLCSISLAKGGLPGYTGWSSTSYLEPNIPFDDRLGRFRITLVSLDSTTATVRVEPGPARNVVSATNVKTTPVLDDSGVQTGGVKVEWAAVAPDDSATAEPSVWTATLFPGGSACSVSVFARSCTVYRVPRSVPLVAVVSGTAPAGKSVAAGIPVEPVPNSPPLVSAETTAGETTVEVRAQVIDDGGLPVSAIVVTKVDGPSCDATVSRCAFSELPANHTTTFRVEASNSSGKRMVNVDVTTLPRLPAAPVGSLSSNGTTETVTIDASPLDRFNVASIYLTCFRNDKNGTGSWTSFGDPLPYTGVPVEKVFDSTRWKIYRCDAYAMSTKVRGLSAPAVIVPGGSQKGNNGTDGGEVTPVPVVNPITLSVRAERFARGRYVVRWTAKSRDGKSVRVTIPKFGSRKCATRTRNSCVVVGLRTGKTYSVTFVAKTSSATKKTRFSIKVP
jgi:hypothetical protein